jgi:hypothetical protein
MSGIENGKVARIVKRSDACWSRGDDGANWGEGGIIVTPDGGIISVTARDKALKLAELAAAESFVREIPLQSIASPEDPLAESKPGTVINIDSKRRHVAPASLGHLGDVAIGPNIDTVALP